MKRLSLQWRITLMTALLIAGACICLNLLLYRSGASGMDNLNGYILQYQQDGGEDLTIEIPEDQMSDFLVQFSQEVYDTKTIFGRKGWCITAVVTLFSAAIAYFISGKALEPLKELAQQAEKVDQDNLVDVRLEENTVAEFRQLSQSVNQMLDRLAHSFDLQRQFAGNAAHELKTPLAIMQAKLEIFAEDHMNTDAETAELVHFQTEQIARLSALVRTLLEMSNLQAVPRDDCIELAPLADEIVTDLTPLAQKKQITLHQECEDIHIIGSDALIYRMLFNLVENAIKYSFRGCKGEHRLTIEAVKAEEQLHLIIVNNGQCIEKVRLKELNEGTKIKNHLGISNVRKRLELYYGEDTAVYFENILSGGVKVHLFIPIQGGNDDADSSH